MTRTTVARGPAPWRWPCCAVVLVAAPAHAAAYRYWTYWQAPSGRSAWTFATQGPGTSVPADGSVEGWRFGVTTAVRATADDAPRHAARLRRRSAASTPAAAGRKRVALVVDPGPGGHRARRADAAGDRHHLRRGRARRHGLRRPPLGRRRADGGRPRLRARRLPARASAPRPRRRRGGRAARARGRRRPRAVTAAVGHRPAHGPGRRPAAPAAARPWRPSPSPPCSSARPPFGWRRLRGAADDRRTRAGCTRAPGGSGPSAWPPPRAAPPTRCSCSCSSAPPAWSSAPAARTRRGPARSAFFVRLGRRRHRRPGGRAGRCSAPPLGTDRPRRPAGHRRCPTWLAGVRLGGDLTLESLLLALYDGLRLATILICVGAANSLASPTRLLKSVPAALYELGVSVVVALTFTPQLVADVDRLTTARRLRGRPDDRVRARSPASAVPVLEGALERSRDARRRHGLARLRPPRRRAAPGGGARVRRCCSAASSPPASASTAWSPPTRPSLLGLPMLVVGVGTAVAGMALAGRAARCARATGPIRGGCPSGSSAAPASPSALLLAGASWLGVAGHARPPSTRPAWPQPAARRHRRRRSSPRPRR